MNLSKNSNSSIPLNPLPATELELLSVFVGNWHAEGDSYGDHQSEDYPYASAVRWVSDESYEWMSGNYFLIHRWQASVGAQTFKGLEIMGYDVARKEFFTRMFDNGGSATKYKVINKDDTWKFSEPFTRSSVLFSDNNNLMTFQWQWRHEGSDWLPLCNRKAIKNND